MRTDQHPQRTHPQITVHDRLRKAREFAGLEQAELAERIEVDRGSIHNYETGKTTRLKAPVMRRWAMACEVDYDWIVTGIVPEPGPDEGAEQGVPSTKWFADAA